jgi:hypothetical protein
LISKPLELLDFLFEVGFIFLLKTSGAREKNVPVIRRREENWRKDEIESLSRQTCRFPHLLIAVGGVVHLLPYILKSLDTLRHLFQATINFTWNRNKVLIGLHRK